MTEDRGPRTGKGVASLPTGPNSSMVKQKNNRADVYIHWSFCFEDLHFSGLFPVGSAASNGHQSRVIDEKLTGDLPCASFRVCRTGDGGPE